MAKKLIAKTTTESGTRVVRGRLKKASSMTALRRDFPSGAYYCIFHTATHIGGVTHKHGEVVVNGSYKNSVFNKPIANLKTQQTCFTKDGL